MHSIECAAIGTVVAADVYAIAPHVGRGCWTWYTVSAAWMQRAGVESILGFRLQGEVLELGPCIPPEWPGFEIVFRHGTTRYGTRVEKPDGVARGIVSAVDDGSTAATRPLRVPLANDGATHRLPVRLG